MIQRVIPRIVAGLSMMGRNSLEVFCVASILSLLGQVVRFQFRGDIVVDTVLVFFGVSAMLLAGWMAEWQSRVRPAK